MMESHRAEWARNKVEIPEDRENYERWDSALGGIFSQLGITRALRDGDFSREERLRILLADKKDWEEVVALCPEDERASLEADLSALAANDAKAADRLVVRFAELVRYAGQRIRELAPPRSERQLDEDDPHQTHMFLEGREPDLLGDRILRAINMHDDGVDASIDFYYVIGDLQRLLAIIEKLRPKIDDGDIAVGDRDADTCVAQIVAARDMLVRALRPSTDHGGYPGVDAAAMDVAVLDQAVDIAGWLSEVKAMSV